MQFVTKEAMNKGWSSDKKYCVADKNGTRSLLRVADASRHDLRLKPRKGNVLGKYLL